MSKTTLISFDQQGGMKVEQQGFVGKQCEDATAKLIGNIGAAKKKEIRKPEYEMRAGATNKQSAGRW